MCVLQHISYGGTAGVPTYASSLGRGDSTRAIFGRRGGSIAANLHPLEAE